MRLSNFFTLVVMDDSGIFVTSRVNPDGESLKTTGVRNVKEAKKAIALQFDDQSTFEDIRRIIESENVRTHEFYLTD